MDKKAISERVARSVVAVEKMDRSFSKTGSLISVYWQIPIRYGWLDEVKKAMDTVAKARKAEVPVFETMAGKVSSTGGSPRVYYNNKRKDVVVGVSAVMDYGEDKEGLNEMLLNWQRWGG